MAPRPYRMKPKFARSSIPANAGIHLLKLRLDDMVRDGPLPSQGHDTLLLEGECNV